MNESKKLFAGFLEKAKSLNTDIEPVKILRSNTFRIGNANVLIRTASDLGRRYFFGLNYINAEEIYNLENSFIAFVCGQLNQIVFLPTNVLMANLSELSHDRNGEYKINFDRKFNLVLRGRGKVVDCSKYVNNWQLFLESKGLMPLTMTPDESLHNIIQGRLIEIGNIRGFQTYCPNKSKTFNLRRLDELATLQECPNLQFTDPLSLRNIDVIWFRNIDKGHYPEFAFEVELSTGVWSGFGRLATLREYNSRLYIISNDDKKFNQVSSSFPELRPRYIHVVPDQVGLLYSAEINLIKMREEFNL